MTPERWAQIRQIFEGALERSQRDRAAYLRVMCAGDNDLRREVETLLASHDQSGDFLNAPAVDLNRALLAAEDLSGEFPRIPRLGPYELEKRIGRGGMGSVWLARRFDHEYEKKVAIKMVKNGMGTQEILRRFRTERQVLAGLDHPNIAHLIDGGSTPEGLPYLVMEYVEGTPIDQYCESRQIPITERLKLFRRVCAAVQYAHQNLVVHRDIKASNILVTADGTPKLLDFGIAKLLRSEFSTLSAAETRPEMRPMTLDYASPEQVRGEPVSTATDVYSLGVLLYKLLTGKFPYGRGIQSREAMVRAICEMEPPRPSAVILTDEDSAIPQATQKMEAAPPAMLAPETREKARRRLKRKLAGYLDVIILKALRKEPARRYASVEQFSEDIRRYLEGRPVKARSDTFGYRTGKFIRRNTAAVAVAGAAAVVLVAVTIWSVELARVDKQLLQSAEQRVSKLAPAVVENYEQLAELHRPANPARAISEYRSAIDAADDYLSAHAGDAAMRQRLARISMKLAELVPADAARLYGRALEQFEAAALASPQDRDRQRDVLEAARKLGFEQYRSGDLLAALTSFSRALQAADGLAAAYPSPAARRTLAECNYEIGEVLARNGAHEAAAAKLRKALDLYRELASLPRASAGARSPEEIEKALRELAGDAPDELGDAIEREINLWKG